MTEKLKPCKKCGVLPKLVQDEQPSPWGVPLFPQYERPYRYQCLNCKQNEALKDEQMKIHEWNERQK